jgi:hypothetical protein
MRSHFAAHFAFDFPGLRAGRAGVRLTKTMAKTTVKTV